MIDLQFPQLLTELPGVLIDGGDEIIGQTQLLQRWQPIQPRFSNSRQIIEIQLPRQWKRYR